MKRRIKSVPIIILLLLIALGVVYFFVVLPNKSVVKEFFRQKEETYFENTTWTSYESPYQIDHHVIVEEGVQLTIEPGVEIIMGPNAKFTIYGHLQAHGTENNPVSFTGREHTPGYWEGIIFTAYCGIERRYERDHPVMQYCVVRDARQAIRTEGCPVDILDCWFQNNVKAVEINQTANIRVNDNSFLNCQEALRIHQEVPLSNLDFVSVTGNEFEQCQAITLGGSVDFGYNYIHNSGSEYGAVTIAPPDSHRVIFHHNQLKNHRRAVEVENLQAVKVEIRQNCFENNGIHLYMECTNAKEADLMIRENNFLRFHQFSLKAIEGCAETDQEKVDISGNYWGTNDKNQIIESFWNYSGASSVRLFSYRFIPFSCKWKNKKAASEDAVLAVEEEDLSLEENTLEDNLEDISNNLKKKLDSILLEKENGLSTTEVRIEIGSKTITGMEVDSLFEAINFKLAKGKSIDLTVDENGNLVMREIDDAPDTETPVIEMEETVGSNCHLTDIPEDVLINRSFWVDEDEGAKSIFLCPYASYFTYYKQRRTIYVGRNASAYLMDTGNHTVYVEAGGRIRVNLTSEGNKIYHHPDAILQGEFKSKNVTSLVECPNLDFSTLIDYSKCD